MCPACTVYPRGQAPLQKCSEKKVVNAKSRGGLLEDTVAQHVQVDASSVYFKTRYLTGTEEVKLMPGRLSKLSERATEGLKIEGQ